MDSLVIGVEIAGMPAALAQIKQFATVVNQVPALIKVGVEVANANKIVRLQRQAIAASTGAMPAIQQPAATVGVLGNGSSVIKEIGKQVIDTAHIGPIGVGKGGGGSLLGPLLKAIPPEFNLVTTAAFALAKAADQAAQNLKEIRAAQYHSGATLAESINLNTTGRALGLSPGDMGDMARTLSDALQTSPGAQMFGSRIGIHDYGMFDDVDKAKNLKKAMDYIMNTKSTEDAIRAARSLHLEEMLMFRDLSEQTKKQLDLDIEFRKGLTSQQDVHNSAEFNVSLNRMKGAFGDLSNVIGQKFLPMATYAMDQITKAAEGDTKIIRNMGDNPETRAAVNAVKPAMPLDHLWDGSLGNNLREWMKNLIDPTHKDRDKEHQDALDKNTDAINKATAWQMKSGTYGGGERAGRAIPKGWTGANFNAWGPGGAAALGAFQL